MRVLKQSESGHLTRERNLQQELVLISRIVTTASKHGKKLKTNHKKKAKQKAKQMELITNQYVDNFHAH